LPKEKQHVITANKSGITYAAFVVSVLRTATMGQELPILLTRAVSLPSYMDNKINFLGSEKK
jgi:hypothetical protein